MVRTSSIKGPVLSVKQQAHMLFWFIGAAELKCKRLGEVECGSKVVVINKYTLTLLVS